MVFYEGDPGDSFHLVERGHIALRITTPRGDTATLDIIGPRGFFGEQVLIAEVGVRTASAVALDRAETLSIQRSQFDELRSTHDWVDRFLVEILAAQVRATSTRLVEALYVPAPARVTAQLRRLAEVFAQTERGESIPVTQEDVATMVGATRPTVNRVLRSLQEQGIVQLGRGTITITELDALDAARP